MLVARLELKTPASWFIPAGSTSLLPLPICHSQGVPSAILRTLFLSWGTHLWSSLCASEF